MIKPLDRFATVSLLSLLLLLFPWSLSTQTSSFSISLDLDNSEGDQAVSSLDVFPNRTIPIQIFGTDIQGANDIYLRFEFDPSQVAYEGFKRGSIVSGTSALTGKDFANIGITLSDGNTSNGLIGSIHFRTTEAFSGTDIRLVRAKLVREGHSETVPLDLSLTLRIAKPPSPDFDRSGTVGIPDFLLFVDVFGSRRGQEGYESKYDLNVDGEIGIPDFLLFVDNFGKVVNRAPVFTSEPPVMRSVAENMPQGQAIGEPISANDADDQTLTYRLSGADADSFAIEESTGHIQTKGTYNFEQKDSYSLIVHARDGEGGEVSLAVGIAITDIDEPPMQPAPPSVSAIAPTSLTVVWTEPFNTGPEITDYDVQYRQADSDVFSDAEYNGTGQSVRLTGLFSSTRYAIQVRAHNEEGTSKWSESSEWTTSAPPLPPGGRGGGTSPPPQPPQPPPQPPQPPPQPPQPPQPPITGPEAPTFNDGPGTSRSVAENTAPNQNIQHPVSAIDEDGDQLTYRLSGDDAGSFTLNASNGQLRTRSGVTYDYEAVKNSYSVTITADDDHGGSATIDVTIKLTDENETPDMAITLTDENEIPIFDGIKLNVRSAENSQVVCWVFAEDVDSEDSITDYAITGGDDRDRLEVFFFPGQPLVPYIRFKDAPDFENPTDRGRNNTYNVMVTATGGMGPRARTATETITITVTDKNEPPNKPDPPVVSNKTENSLTVTWTEPTNTGPDIDDYDVQYQEGDSGGFIPWAHNSADRTTTITGLTPGTSYEVQVRAHNEEGMSPWSGSGEGMTTGSPLPGGPPAPTNLQATAGNALVTLRWDMPAAGADITRHEYRYKTTMDYSGIWTSIANSAPGEANQASFTVATLTNGTTYAFQVRAVNANERPSDPSNETTVLAGDGLGICSRTNRVMTKILDNISEVSDCALVTDGHLSALFSLVLANQKPPITAIKRGDFAGLSSLKNLYLHGNDLKDLPDDVFTGLSSLTHLGLYNNELTSLTAKMLSGLPSLEGLYLKGNDLKDLPDRVFAGLPSLKELHLGGNQLTTLSEETFSGVPLLTHLWLFDNQLTTLPEGTFSGLTALTKLELEANQLTSLPAKIFLGLSSLNDLKLFINQLTVLPDSLFFGLTKLKKLNLDLNPPDNPVSLPIVVSLASDGEGQFKARAHTGAPFEIVIPISVANGSVDGGATTIAIPAGRVDSDVFTVSRTSGTTPAVTVDIGILPGLPTDHDGYELVKFDNLPLEVIAAVTNGN